MEFIEAPAFTRHPSDYLGDDEYRAVQEELGTNPELGDLMPGTGGFRKMRWADARRGRVAEVGCESSITTSSRIIGYG
jgi:hypothetical protein